MIEYKCDQCGACCKHLIVEIGWIDTLREPRLREAAVPFRYEPGECLVNEDGDQLEITDPYMAGAILVAAKPCAFLGADNACAIYPTRPTCCVGLIAGDEQCQMSREAAGLEPLRPSEEKQ